MELEEEWPMTALQNQQQQQQQKQNQQQNQQQNQVLVDSTNKGSTPLITPNITFTLTSNITSTLTPNITSTLTPNITSTLTSLTPLTPQSTTTNITPITTPEQPSTTLNISGTEQDYDDLLFEQGRKSTRPLVHASSRLTSRSTRVKKVTAPSIRTTQRNNPEDLFEM